MRFRMFCLFLLLWVSVQVTISSKQNKCDEVDCRCYKFEIESITKTQYEECRFKQIKPPKKEKAGFCGLQVHNFGDLTRTSNKKTGRVLDCPKDGKLIMTESLTEGNLTGYFPDSNYRQCCALKVVKRCYHKVTLFTKRDPDAEKKVIKHDYEMNNIDRVLIVFENKTKKKKVTAVFYPDKGILTCKKEYGGQEEQYVNINIREPKICGDPDIDVQIKTFYNNRGTNGTNVMKVKRHDCNSQYVGMFSDPAHRIKFTIRTVVGTESPSGLRYLGRGKGKVEMAPVFANIYVGICGKVANFVGMTRSPNVKDKVSTNKMDDNISTNKMDDNISTNKTDDNISTNKTDDKISPETDPNCRNLSKSDNKTTTDKTDDNISTDKTEDKTYTDKTDDKTSTDKSEDNISTPMLDYNTSTDKSDDKTSTPMLDYSTSTDKSEDKTSTDKSEDNTHIQRNLRPDDYFV